MRWSYYTGPHTKNPGYVLWTEENSVIPVCWINNYKEFRVNIVSSRPVSNIPINIFNSTRVVSYNRRKRRILVQIFSAMVFL